MYSRYSVTLGVLASLFVSQAIFAQSPQPQVMPKPNAAPLAGGKRGTAPGTAAPGATSRPSPDVGSQADKEYLRKNYRQALGLYREALKQRIVPQERRGLVDYRMARCLGYMQLWDEALVESLKVSVRYPGTIWDARSKSWLMRLYLKAPHAGWKVGERYFRGEDAPETEAATPPVAVDLTPEDWRKAALYGEQSKVLYEKLREEVKGTGEEADMAADLARVIAGTQIRSWAQLSQWKPPTDESWKLAPDAPYDLNWAPPKKVLQLFLLAEELGTKPQKPVARLAQAVWLRGYQAFMNRPITIPRPGVTPKRVPFPYQDRLATDILRTLPRDFPDRSEADHALLLVGDWYAEDDQYAEAIAAYELLSKSQPETQWGKAAANAIAAITRVEFSISPPVPQAPGKKAVLEITSRNVSEVKLAAYPIKLEELIKDARVLARPRSGYSELFARLGRTAGIRKFYQGDPVVWTQAISAKQFARTNQNLETPLTRNGAYVIEADAGAAKSTVILVVSDLALIQIADNQRATAMVVNADTGAPVPDATVVIRELYTFDNKPQISAATLTSNEDGLAEKPLAPKRTSSNDVRSFAWKGDRYAFTYGVGAGVPDPGAAQSGYLYTDRAAYRSGQRIFFRGLLSTIKEDATRAPMIGEKARVVLSNPKGVETESREVVANEFGSVDGSFQLGSQPPLGGYTLELLTGTGKEQRVIGTTTLVVEEYKKPEFQVTVTPVGTRPRTGEPLSARLAARYYFGAPVANARVKYTVARTVWTKLSPQSPRGFRGGLGGLVSSDIEQVSSSTSDGTGVTGADGTLEISLDTRVEDPDHRNLHLDFEITAEVTDASRRTIEGGASVRVAATQYDAVVRPEKGFLTPGQTLVTQVTTADILGKPVAAGGTLRYLRMTAVKGELQPDEVSSTPVQTNSNGQGSVNWTPNRAGLYRLRFEGVDDRDRKVIASATVWVAGEEAGSGVLPVEHLAMVPEVPSLGPTGMARILVVTDEPGMTVLLTREWGQSVLEKQVVRLRSRSQVIEIPIKPGYSPDFVVSASGVRGRAFVRAEVLVRVPPVAQLLSFDVLPDKQVYQPGEQAVVKVRVRDSAGRPVRAECSLGASDASLSYVVPEKAASINEMLYGSTRSGQAWFRSGHYPRSGFQEKFDSVDENREAVPKSEPVAWRFPTGLGNIELDVFQSLSHGELATSVGAAGGVAPPEYTDEDHENSRARVRTDFADQAFWSPSVVTDANGEATVNFKWPDNITRWEVTARGWSATAQVGEAKAEVTATKNLLVRLQAPRFFVERDELLLSANIHNYSQVSQDVQVSLALGGDTVYPASGAAPGPPSPRSLTVPRGDRPGAGSVSIGEDPAGAGLPVQQVSLPAGTERRVEWRVRVDRPGSVNVRVTAESASDQDAVELKFPVKVHGVEKHLLKGGSILMSAGDNTGSKSQKVTVTIPAERTPDAGELVVQVSPSAALVMLDALPYLGDYPYGCTEQTLSRFMPAVVSAQVLKELGVDLDDLRKRAASGEGPPAQGRNPVFRSEVLKNMIAAGLDRLRRFQHPDGGWGWWEQDTSDPIITAYVVQGLLAGKEADVAVPATMLERGLVYLTGTFAKEKGPHDKVYQGWVLTLDPKRAPGIAGQLLEGSFPGRERLSAYGLALLSLALKNGGKGPEARLCMQNLETTAKIDREAGTCYWRGDVGRPWDWHNNDVETAAACLRAFQAIEPKHRLAPLVVRWLANNRSGAAWSGTRDTAHAVYALAEYVRKQQELAPDYTVTVDVAGRQQKKFRVNAQNALTFDNRLVVPSAALGSGAQEITVTREGKGNVYFTAALRVFTLEEGIQASGSELRVRRRYFRLTKPDPGEKAETTKDGFVRTLVASGDKLGSGDLLEVELLIESKNSYEHLVFEDLKPSGCEPVDLRSGARFGNGLCSNVELRDDRVAFFITQLPQGKRLINYRMRAEIPGAFHVLPLRGYAMYASFVRCISDEGNLRIEDAAEGRVAARTTAASGGR